MTSVIIITVILMDFGSCWVGWGCPSGCEWPPGRALGDRLLLNHEKTLGFLASGGEEFNPGPETRLDCSELLCNKVILKYKGDRESF